MNWQKIAAEWGEFFLGHPRRTLSIAGAIYAVYLWYHPQIIREAAAYTMNEIVLPLVPLILVVFLALALFRRMTGGKKKSGGH